MGRFDVADVLESGDLGQAEKAAMIVRAYACSTTGLWRLPRGTNFQICSERAQRNRTKAIQRIRERSIQHELFVCSG